MKNLQDQFRVQIKKTEEILDQLKEALRKLEGKKRPGKSKG